MPPSDFRLAVEAVDKASPIFARLEKGIAHVEGQGKKTNAALNDVASGARFAGIEKAFEGIGTAAGGVLDRVTALVPGLAGITAFGTVAGAAGAIVAGVRSYADEAFDVDTQARLLGLSKQRLQERRGATKLAGLDEKTFDSAFLSFADTLENIRFGDDSKSAMLMRKLGVAVPQRGEPLDADRLLTEVTEALPRYTPESQRRIANQLGLSGILPLINQGQERVEALIERVRSELSEQDVEQGKDLKESFSDLEEATKEAAREVQKEWTPAVKGATDALTDFIRAWTRAPGFIDKLDFFSRRMAPAPDPGADGEPRVIIPLKQAPAAPQRTSSTQTPWWAQTPIAETSPETLREIGRNHRLGVSGPNGVATVRIIHENQPRGLKTVVEGDAGAKVQVETKSFMPENAP